MPAACSESRWNRRSATARTSFSSRFRLGHYPKKGTIVAYSDGQGLTLKLFDYRAAREGEEANNFGKVPVLKSLNPAFKDVETLDGGRIEAVFVDVA